MRRVAVRWPLRRRGEHQFVRSNAAFESRYVRKKTAIPILIGMIADEERFVALLASRSGFCTRHASWPFGDVVQTRSR